MHGDSPCLALAGSIGARERPAEHLVEITAAMDAALAVLTQALDEHGTDIVHSLQRLAFDAAAAVPSYLGLSVVVSHSDPPLTVTTLADTAVAGDIRTSLHVLLSGIGDGHDPPLVALILYAGTPGTFVDLAADLTWLTGRPLTDVTLDEHLTVPAGPYTAAQLLAASDVNQAIGVLIGRGCTPEQARRQLDIQAANNRTDRHSAARLILETITAADDDQHFDIHQCGPRGRRL